jgi:predicted dehydrogenase
MTAAGAVAGMVVPHVHAAEDNTINVALVGCGGRGTGAAANALSVQRGPVKLVAMADVFEDRLTGSFNRLSKQFGEKVDVPDDRKFIGFDAYKQAMDCLKPGDVAIFATPPGFRWVHFGYAVGKGLNVFMEKPVTVDGPATRKMYDLAAKADAKNLKVGVGLMSRHSRHLQQLAEKIHNGDIGEIISLRGYRMSGPIGSFRSEKWPGNPSELLWQIRRFHSFLWASGGGYSDFLIHIIDHCCWMKNDWPIEAQSVGGRHYRQNYVDQNFDAYGVEYVFADGARLMMDGRNMAGCVPMYSSYAHGTKGSAIVSKSGDCGPPSTIFQGQTPDSSKQVWQSEAPADQRNPYQNEWEDLIAAIRDDQPYNEAERGAKASLITSMGRMAAHTGQVITYDEILGSDHEFAPGIDQFTMDSPAPIQADADGNYPWPMPGMKKREY